VTRAAVLVVAATLGLAGCQGVDLGIFWQLERMVLQPRYDPYGQSRFFADGRAMRTPPDGAVVHRAAAADDAALADVDADGWVARIPVAVTPALLARGQNRFETFCAACHGFDGRSQTRAAHVMELRPPPALDEDRIRALPAGKIHRVIVAGYGLMPSYAAQLDAHDRWAVTAYVRALQLSQHVELAALPAPVRAEATQALGGGGTR
jgi:mono/diheme cytochrome c family protein